MAYDYDPRLAQRRSIPCPGGIPGCGVAHFTTEPLTAAQPTPLFTLATCPVCEGRMAVPAGFYGGVAVASSTNRETCQTCDGKGLLKIGLTGTVEQV